MTHTYLAFDLGASSGRAIIGKISDGKLDLNEVHRFANGSIELAGTLYWDFPTLCQEIKTGLSKALAIAPEIDSIAIDTWGVDYVLFDQAGEAVRLPYHYRDARTDGIPEEVFSIIPETELYNIAGIQLMQLNTLYQLCAHKKSHPEDFKASTLLFMPDALSYMLCGTKSCEYSIASTSNMLNARDGQWSKEILTKLDIPQDILPEIVDSCTIAGTLLPELQQELGCGAIPVVKVGAHDTASAVAAVPAPNDRPWAYLSCGTWALLGAENDQPLLLDTARKASFTNEGGVGGKIRFLSNIMGSWLFQEVRRNWQVAGRDISFMEMEQLAQAAQPLQFIVNPNSVDFLSPDNMKDAIIEYCRKTGQGEITDDGSLLRCIYDSLALCFRTKLEQMQQLVGAEYQCLNIVGGGTKDKFLMQLSADCLGIPVVSGPVEATAIGNIIGQGIAAGSIATLAAGRELVKNSFDLDNFTPDATTKAAWDKALEVFIALP
jgi:rhamnulokinase